MAGLLYRLQAKFMFKQVLNRLIGKAKAFGTYIMSVEIFETAYELSELAKISNDKKSVVIAKVRDELWNHQNRHTRRVAVTCIRHIGDLNFPGLAEDLVAKLSDPAAWVQYDAAWAIKQAGLRTPEALAALTKLANGMVAPSAAEKDKLLEGDIGNAELQAQIGAAEALKELET